MNRIIRRGKSVLQKFKNILASRDDKINVVKEVWGQEIYLENYLIISELEKVIGKSSKKVYLLSVPIFNDRLSLVHIRTEKQLKIHRNLNRLLSLIFESLFSLCTNIQRSFKFGTYFIYKKYIKNI